MRFDLVDLRLFLHVLDAGSISKGCLQANLALASASERLRLMEEEAGVRLLERHSRGVVATQAGEAVAHRARLILQQQGVLKQELKGFASGATGTLSLYANTAALTHFLPGRLADWLAERPQIFMDLRERTSAGIIQGVTAGLIEAGIVSDSATAPGLQRQRIAKDHLVLIVSQRHRLAARKAVPFADALQEVFVGLAPGNALQDHLQDQALALGKDFTTRIQMKTFDGLCMMVDQGIGVGIVPQGIATHYRRRHTFRTLALDEEWARRHLCVVYKDWLELTPLMQNLLIHLGATANVSNSIS